MIEPALIDREVKRRVAEAREANELSKQFVADKLGLSRQNYQNYEDGDVPFSVQQVWRLSIVLGKSPAWILRIDTKLDPQEDEMLHAFRRAKAVDRPIILRLLRDLVDNLTTRQNGNGGTVSPVG